MVRVIVVGAGISGLSTAFWLKQLGHDVTLLEKKERTGGVIQTLNQDGYLFEKGPNSFLDNAPDTLELCEKLNLDNELLKQSMRSNKRYIYLNDQLNEVPAGPQVLFDKNLMTKKARRKIFTEAFRGGNRSEQDESLADFIRRRLGEDVLNNLVTPFVSGVYAGDPEKLSMKATFRTLFDLERQHGSLIRGAIFGRFKKKKGEPKQKKTRAKHLCSFVDGMEVLVQKLTENLGNRVRLGVLINKIEKSNTCFTVQYNQENLLSCDALVMAVPANIVADMIPELIPNSHEYLHSIPYNRLCVLGMGFNKEDIEHPCDGFGFLVPRNQGIRFLGSIWGSSLFVRRAPEGKRAFSVFIGGGLDPDAYNLKDQQLIEQVLIDLQKTVGITKEPECCHIFRWEKAIPQYPIGHVEKMTILSQELDNNPGLHLTGNYRDGVSVNDCIRNAKSTAEAIHQWADQKKRM